MRCVRCAQPILNLAEPCPHCGLSADPALLEELMHIRWLLDQARTPGRFAARTRQILEDDYGPRARELEVRIGLRPQPYTLEQAASAWPLLARLLFLQDRLTEWIADGKVTPAAGNSILDDTRKQSEGIRERLEGHPQPIAQPGDTDRLAAISHALQVVDTLHHLGGFRSDTAEAQVRSALEAQKAHLEFLLGVRPSPIPSPPAPQETPASPQAVPVAAPALPAPPPPPAPPPQPAQPPPPFRDRLWRTLLSERTLQAMLFLGIFLLFSAAISFVFWGWQSFSAPLRVAIPSAFTLLFLGLGWYVRTRTGMNRSGIALMAIAALLIPVDFYTVYINFDIPPQAGPLFWLMTSVVCMIAYLGVAWFTQSPLFGYLVAGAAGSTALALVELGHQVFGLSLDWRSASLSLVAVGLVLVATALNTGGSFWARMAVRARRPILAHPDASPASEDHASFANHASSADEVAASQDKPSISDRPVAESGRASDRGPRGPQRAASQNWQMLAEPFRYLALIAIAAIMLISFGWRYIERPHFDTLHYAMTVNWWLGALLLGWGAVYYRSRTFGILAAVTPPIAVYMAQAALFDLGHINLAWHALGLALLVPLYFAAGHRLLLRKDDPVLYGHGRTATGWGIVLTIVAALWSLADLKSAAAAASSHAVLIGAMVLVAFLWRRPRVLLAASLFSFTAVSFAMNELNVDFAQLAVGWASLSILHILLALRLGRVKTALYAQFAGMLVLAGFVIAGLALAPPLAPYKGSLLAYVLLNWIGLAAWAARLAHRQQPGFVHTRWKGIPLYQWMAALPLPLWVWILFDNQGALDWKLPLALAALAWALVLLSWRLARVAREYRWPWYGVGLGVSVLAPVTAFVIAPDSYAPGICVLASGALYLVDALVNRQRYELTPSGLLMAVGAMLLVERLTHNTNLANVGLATPVAVYILVGLWAERSRRLTHQFLVPLYFAAHLVAAF
ncbi:MAG: hypothetical protein WCF84_18835, partial [Anaerolineae bacterium]